MAANTGTATIDFGAFPGTSEASVEVTGQAEISTTSKAEAWLMSDSTSDHTESDHRYASLLIGLTCGTPTLATGFTIHARCLDKMQGTFAVRWVWAD